MGSKAGLDAAAPVENRNLVAQPIAMKAYGGVDLKLHAFTISAMDRGEW
jgi:hypothetical protein